MFCARLSSVLIILNFALVYAWAGPAKGSDENAEQVLCGFLGLPGRPGCSEAARHSIDMLVVTVPDPEKSHLGLYFDRTVESLQRAAADLGYTFDRYWLPWGEQEKEDKGNSGQPNIARPPVRRNRQGAPGLLLFRRSPRPLVVFLIGETPTSGIDEKAFLTALHFLPDGATVRIAGPAFSGSLPSLLSLSELAAARRIRFRVISGAATVLESGNDFRKAIEARGGRYDTVLHNDRCARDAFLAHVREQWADGGTVAILSEDETSYGQQTESALLNIHFPRQISRLRNAYQEDAELSGAPKNGTPRQFLALKLKDTLAGSDSVPYFATDQTPLSQEAMMASIASTLQRERVKLAGIVATDILDALFIGRYLRKSCPDTRLFLLDSDLLLVQAANTLPFDGILAVTTYPLFSRNQFWVSEPKDGLRRMLFASRYAEGFYNAIRALVLEDRNRAAVEPLVEYASPTAQGGSKPPIWLTVVSRTGYWPLAVLTDPPQTDPLLLAWTAPSERGSRLTPEQPPRFWAFLFWILTAACLSYSIALFRAQRSGGARWLVRFSVRPQEPGALNRAFFLLTGALALGCAYAVLAGAAMRLSVEPGVYVGWAVAYSRVATFVLALFAAASLAPCAAVAGRILRRRPAATIYLWFSLLSCAICGVFVWLGWSAFLQTSHQQGFFFAYRSLNLASGVSPLPPLLLLAAALWIWAWVHLRRITYHIEMRPSLPRISVYHATGVLHDIERKVNDGLSRVVLHRPEIRFLALLAATGTVIAAPWNNLRSFEYRTYDWLFASALILVYSLVFLTWLRFLYVWFVLREFLEDLERHPFRDAFSALGPEYSWSPVWQQGGMRRTYDLLVKSVECVQMYTASASRRDLQGKCSALQESVEEVLKTAAQGRHETVFQLRRVQRRLVGVGDELVAALDTAHWTVQRPPAFAAAAAGGATGDAIVSAVQPEQCAELELASRFVALRYLEYIRYVLLQLRGLLSFITAGFILSLLALNSYPFQSEYLTGWTVTGICLALGAGVVLVFAQMHRDAVLSRLTTGTAGTLGKTFYLRVASYGALPLLTVIASQFPGVGRFLLSWVQPALEGLR